MYSHKFETNFCILKESSGESALGVLCNSQDIYVYGMKKFSGKHQGIYVDVTYLTDIGNNWKQYKKYFNEKDGEILNSQRDDNDPILKKEPNWKNVLLIPWKFVSEFETSEQGVFIVSMIYDCLKDVKYADFIRMSKED